MKTSLRPFASSSFQSIDQQTEEKISSDEESLPNSM
jgi:hypothetical protein